MRTHHAPERSCPGLPGPLCLDPMLAQGAVKLPRTLTLENAVLPTSDT